MSKIPIQIICPENPCVAFIGWAHCPKCHPRPQFKTREEKVEWLNKTPRLVGENPVVEGNPHIHLYCLECNEGKCWGIAMGEDD